MRLNRIQLLIGVSALLAAVWPGGAVTRSVGKDDLERCGVCHRYAWRTYRSDLHGIAARAGDRSMPTCITCHGSKAIAIPLILKNQTPEQARTKSFACCLPCHPALQDNPRLARHLVAFHQDLRLSAPREYANFISFWRYFPGKAAWATRWFLVLAAGALGALLLFYLLALWSRLIRCPDLAAATQATPPAGRRRVAWAVLVMTLALTLTGLTLLWSDGVMSPPLWALFGSPMVLRQMHQALGLAFVVLLLVWLAGTRQQVASGAPFLRLGRMLFALKSPRTLLAVNPTLIPKEQELFQISSSDLFSLLLLPGFLVAWAGVCLAWDRVSLALLPKWGFDSLLWAHAWGGIMLLLWSGFVYGGLVLVQPWLARQAKSALPRPVGEKADARE